MKRGVVARRAARALRGRLARRNASRRRPAGRCCRRPGARTSARSRTSTTATWRARTTSATARIEAFERLAGRRLSWVYFSQNWYRGLQFPRERVQTIWQHGAVPYVAFLPTSGDFYGPGPNRSTAGAAVHAPADHRRRLRPPAARLGGRRPRPRTCPMLLSFGAEVNDDWGPWSAGWNGAGETTGYGDPAYPDGAERYRDAYRHVVKRLPRGGRDATSPSSSTSTRTRRTTAGTSCTGTTRATPTSTGSGSRSTAGSTRASRSRRSRRSSTAPASTGRWRS